MDYIIKRSNRRTLSVTVNSDAQVIVRAPYFISKGQIEKFLDSSSVWIEEHIRKAEKKKSVIFDIPKENMAQAKLEAKKLISPIAEHYADMTGLYPASIKITSAKTRLGSCSGKNGICFSVYLIKYPEKAIEYVILHELAHIKYKNHGKQFYEFIESYMPDFKERIGLIKNI